MSAPLKQQQKQQKGKAKKPSKALIQEEQDARRQAEVNQVKARLRPAVEARVQKEQKGFETQLLLVDTQTMSAQELRQASRHLMPGLYQDVVIERALMLKCGYPICGNKLPNSLPNDLERPRLRFSFAKGVYDESHLTPFCSQDCYAASKFYEMNLSTEALYLRPENFPLAELYQPEGTSKTEERETSLAAGLEVFQASVHKIEDNLPKGMERMTISIKETDLTVPLLPGNNTPATTQPDNHPIPAPQPKTSSSPSVKKQPPSAPSVQSFQSSVTIQSSLLSDSPGKSYDSNPTKVVMFDYSPAPKTQRVPSEPEKEKTPKIVNDVKKESQEKAKSMENKDEEEDHDEWEDDSNDDDYEEDDTTEDEDDLPLPKVALPKMELSLFGRVWKTLSGFVTRETRNYLDYLKYETEGVYSGPADREKYLSNPAEDDPTAPPDRIFHDFSSVAVRDTIFIKKLLSGLIIVRQDLKIESNLNDVFTGMVSTFRVDETVSELKPVDIHVICLVLVAVSARVLPRVEKNLGGGGLPKAVAAFKEVKLTPEHMKCFLDLFD